MIGTEATRLRSRRTEPIVPVLRVAYVAFGPAPSPLIACAFVACRLPGSGCPRAASLPSVDAQFHPTHLGHPGHTANSSFVDYRRRFEIDARLSLMFLRASDDLTVSICPIGHLTKCVIPNVALACRIVVGDPLPVIHDDLKQTPLGFLSRAPLDSVGQPLVFHSVAPHCEAGNFKS